MIPAHIAGQIPEHIRARGEAYSASGRVRILGADAIDIEAVVRGSREYLVAISAVAGFILASCTCPYAATGLPCKHVWALLVSADRDGLVGELLEEAGPVAEIVIDELMDAPAPRAPRQPPRPAWQLALDAARREMEMQQPGDDAEQEVVWPTGRRLVYIIDLPASSHSAGAVLELGLEREDRDGAWGEPVAFRLGARVWRAVPDPADRQIAQMLIGASASHLYEPQRTSGFLLRGAAMDATLPLICATGRCRIRTAPGERPTTPARWDDGPPWRLALRLAHADDDEGFVLGGILKRPGQEMSLAEPSMLHGEGFLVADGAIARMEDVGTFALATALRTGPGLRATRAELPALISALLALPRVPALELPTDVGVTEARAEPIPCLSIETVRMSWRGQQHRLALRFQYGGALTAPGDRGASVFDADALAIRRRDRAFEAAARARLAKLGARDEWNPSGGAPILTVPTARLAALVGELAAAGWRMESDGVVYRVAGVTRADVRSGIDWFELDAGVRYGDVEVGLHELLAARRAGSSTVTLPDGSVGVLPLEWLARLGPLTAGGTVVDGALRFRRTQALLLDALLAALPEADVDATFATAREELRGFDRVAPVDPPQGFTGTLREYQREGLGWLHFLRRFHLGGCLADDMGLGKTVQVLALLQATHGPGGDARHPSLVVVPKSLVFNWMREAERFTPALRLLDFTGMGRDRSAIDPASVDVVITTYGTLRRDAAALTAIHFHYAILDEAQAIKNASSASAKAARLIRAEHRLVMSGTPIENRLEELWSLFEFLNPGMLGSSAAFASLLRLPVDGARAGGRDLLGAALRPVILRRTKAQVATELPRRVEQTLSVELEGAQRKFYDGLLESYRRSVLGEVDRVGLNRSRMHILEALLRLRQAACHPALVDVRKGGAPSAKLDALIPALEEVVAEGHKALVFSQFTSFLALLRERLDAAGMKYEYLDGRTRDRQARVDRFQSDEGSPLFLISLKAGGHGLNLTAADYVYILDPWWNPAVEAQAIDRAHRIGQTRHVMATRLVARDTIEEKILQLQASKRALAEAIIGQDQGVLAKIGREELELLLG